MFNFFAVGGAVRDEILGIKSKDIDYVAVPDPNRFPPRKDIHLVFEALVNYLKQTGFEMFLITAKMLTIRARFPTSHKFAGTTADFVLARKEIGYIEGTREPIVVIGTLDDDLRRRDFTVNAIAKNEHGLLYDPFGGIDDIKAGILHTPISGNITFADDPLRILRAIRFSVTKGFLIDYEISEILKQFDYENQFSCVSEERIREELTKCFKHNTWDTLLLLEEYRELRSYIFKRTKLWLKPTNEE